ncbi:TonB-dependent receptor [Parahaliea maris]|uniref:TonB-dependent receptor n=1 Tax=Parahaliea maris TaxID=2716870 RepID=A0A5C8ZWD1_9GAMM|nr:TonB-dependent receptor [Parahaliea maris]TXS92064.1 TonB-dependent receptor [Parahaliea maris]
MSTKAVSTPHSTLYTALRACLYGTAGAAALASTQVQAQGAAALEEVVITGSRVARSGFETPTPVSALSAEDIKADGSANVAEFVMTLPSVQGSTTGSTSSGALSNGEAGIAALNLRALGAGRTLVLLDGQRSVVSSSSGRVDTNTFPQSLVKRVEVVTGGASSAYGSDAVSGVVNFILDKDYEGFKVDLEYGQVGSGGGENDKITLTGGIPFADGDGHLLFSAEQANQDGIHYEAPDWAQKGHFAMVNPNPGAGAPTFITGNNIGISAYTPGGLIVDGPLMGTYFGEGGSINQLNYGAVAGQWMQGGDWEYTNSGMVGTNSLLAEDNRDSVFGRVSYKLTDSLEVFGQASYAGYEGYSHYINPTDRNITIYADNAYLPDEVAAAMAEQGLDSFLMSTSNADMPASGSRNKRETVRLVAGAEGIFEAFGKSVDWDFYYQHGKTETDEHQTPTFNFSRLAMATDAVIDPATGGIVCRSTLSDPGNGCVPLNRFGTGVANEDGLDYVLGRPRRQQEFQQDVAALTFNTNDFEGWAGPISLAFGLEWRKEQMDADVDDEYTSGWKYGNYKETRGEYDVTEFFVETVVPIFDGLDFNGAARLTDYSTSGEVTTWKAGFTYAPIDDVTFRVTQSRDIRAPNLSELYETGTARTNAVAINGESVPFIQALKGNPTVAPEEADTLGLGIVLQPSFAPGLALSADYYEIEIDGVISFVGAQDVADFCFINNVQSYCDQMNYVNGQLSTIDLYYDNLNSMTAKGIDYEVSYMFSPGDLIDGFPGQVSLRAMATNYLENITDNGVTARDLAGVNDNWNYTPDWVYRMTATYTLEDWMFNLTLRGVSDGVLSNEFVQCSSNCPTVAAGKYTINDNSVDGGLFTDAYLSKVMSFGDVESEFFISVKNVFDEDPELISNPFYQGGENTVAYLQTNRTLYDTLGRTFRVGMRLEF